MTTATEIRKRITRACGHKETMTGTAQELEWLSTVTCAKCWTKTKAMLYGVD